MHAKTFELFVPGRVCLFGEHSDWAGGHRRINSALAPGLAVLAGTNQGIHARVEPHPDRLVFISSQTGPDGQRLRFEAPMRAESLLEEARRGGFFSYVAGVAWQILTHYAVKGLVIDNGRTDLPIKKGLSSSAAVCVLTARAFNLVYDLKMTTRGEMDLAYRGEIVTPSRCGRLDQGCAYGGRPILMEFDGDNLDVSELRCAAPLYMLLVDLKAKKDTIRILADLNKAFPFAENETERAVQNYLGPENRRIVGEVVAAMGRGEAARVGALMNEAQARFDAALGPACPGELAAPVLHRALKHPALQPYIWGGKGVGSQGDGTAQFLCRDEAARERAVEILEKELGLGCLRLTIPASRRVRKALVTAAGFGTRLYPMTAAVRKEFLPVVGPDGEMKPLILANVEEVLAAGIEAVGLIIQAADRRLFEDFFGQNLPPEHYAKLTPAGRAALERIRAAGRKVSLIVQGEQKGLGHAVLAARDWIGGEPFLLVLGDHLFVSKNESSCAGQLLDAAERFDGCLIGLQPTPEAEIGRFGTVAGSWLEDRRTLELSELKEKPTADYAREYLRVEGLPEGSYLTVFGHYVLAPELFDVLERNAGRAAEPGAEVQLTDALEELRSGRPFRGLVIAGEKIDIGVPEGYLEGLRKFRARQ